VNVFVFKEMEESTLRLTLETREGKLLIITLNSELLIGGDTPGRVEQSSISHFPVGCGVIVHSLQDGVFAISRASISL
jgi:hypothetical protein